MNTTASAVWPSAGHLLLAAFLGLAVAGAAKAVRALSLSGALAAAVVGFLFFGFGGGRAAAALLLFFITSSVLSRVGKRRKEALAFEKGGERDAGQVLANGGVAAVCALFLPLFPTISWPVAALLGALGAANADTWATEIGSLARRPPYLITTLKPAPTGASGAVSLPGTLAALGGAALLGSMALFWVLGWRGVAAVTLGGFFGGLFDSVLGATIQAQYRCPQCDALTERHFHCDGQKTTLARGFPWMNNDVVNTLATLAGAILSAVLILVLKPSH